MHTTHESTQDTVCANRTRHAVPETEVNLLPGFFLLFVRFRECRRRGDKSDNEVTKVTKVTLGDNTISSLKTSPTGSLQAL